MPYVAPRAQEAQLILVVLFFIFAISLAQEQAGLGWRSKPVLYQRDGDDVMLACFILSSTNHNLT